MTFTADRHRLMGACAFCSVTGIQDFFTMPIVQYRRDGRVWRGLQKGALSLKTSAQLAVLDLLLKLLDSVQVSGVVCPCNVDAILPLRYGYHFTTVVWPLFCHCSVYIILPSFICVQVCWCGQIFIHLCRM